MEQQMDRFKNHFLQQGASLPAAAVRSRAITVWTAPPVTGGRGEGQILQCIVWMAVLLTRYESVLNFDCIQSSCILADPYKSFRIENEL